MKVWELISELQRENPRGDMEVKVATSVLDEHGVPIESLLVQEYDDGSLFYEIVIIPDEEYLSL